MVNEDTTQYACGFVFLICDHQQYIDQLLKIPNKITLYIPWSRV